ncbi:MAG: hypothetical protein Q8M76_03695, partial [Spirochaetaceae bacterium]|nr:hypothetical protein [Spirochaetaceae bacterium]
MTSNTSLTIRSTGRAAMASFIAALALILPTACDMFGMGGDLTPPNNVVSLAASPGDRFVTLTWIDPGDSDLESVEISQTPGGLAKLLVGAGAQTA